MTKETRNIWIYRAIFIVLGGIGGYIYWFTIGCESGTCPITSKWMNTTLYGGVMGYLFGDLIRDLFNKTKKHKNEQLSENN